MNFKNYHTAPHSPTDGPQESSDPLSSIDFEKLQNVFLNNIIWVVLIIFLINAGSYLYIRYTKPLYNSESILKLDIKSEAGILGIQNPLENDIKGLAGEIEILKSRLFASKVVDAVGMEVSYYHPGRSHLYDERYGNSPFKVDFEILEPGIRDRALNIEIQNDKSFVLDFDYLGINYRKKCNFNDTIAFSFVKLYFSKTKYFEEQKNLVDFYFVLNSREALIDYFQNHIEVEPVNFNANTIKVSLTDYNQVKAKSLVQAIDTIYLNYTKSAKNQAVEQKIAFLQNQMDKTQKDLEAFEQYFERFTIQNRTTDLSQDLNYTIKILNQLDSQRFNIQNQIGVVDLAIKQLKADRTINMIELPKPMVQVIEDYNELKDERALKLESYNENTQIIQRLNSQIEIAKSSALDQLSAMKENLAESQVEVSKKRRTLESSFAQLPSMGTSFNKNRRLYSLQEEFYFSLIESKIELEIARAGTVTNFVILSPASSPSAPVEPKKMLVYGASAVASLLFSFLFIAVSYLLDDKISNSKELERLLIAPLLGVVPKFVSEKLQVSSLVVSRNPKSSISEALRSIRTNMEFMNTGNGRKLISITSTVSGEGKTFVAVNLGAIFAYTGLKVVVVDLDMRKPKVHLAFNSEAENRGVSTILINKDSVKDCLKKTEVENLSFIGAGPTPPNPSELILGENFDKMLEELKQEFDIVMLDTPPVGLVTDGILVMKKCDLPVYVVRSDYSKKSYLKSIHRLIKSNGFDNLSVIFNAASSKGSYGYGYGYGKGSGYYEEASQSSSKLKRIFSKKS
ncbi:GumC family protein [Reichenbachiella ulvae]|uniref:non-specific protein-tyrosine kinase n=1 Tax=Reichenbachiella ulvae TaxID=2980104 RepID=A0ABT3CYQ3_9BACT|nr:tyrosine-protein kinase [Reichenbachiella ulvae]MCV9388620.1 polysaccharide biosynthesis tyrosine autokinase [Reichenbachiella ulvae]